MQSNSSNSQAQNYFQNVVNSSVHTMDIVANVRSHVQ